MDIMARYELWCKKVKDETLAKELKAMKGNSTAIENAFFKDLEFGTGGLRGEIGVGTNCLNIYTIAKVTQGIADCMKKYNLKTAAVSCDSRINSDIFVKKVAEVFASNGITAHISKELMPTPFLSYLTRETHSDIGVMVTASHNPAKYNGYKVYDEQGCQLTDERANEMIDYINKVDPFDVVTGELDSYVKEGLVKYADDEIERAYMAEVKSQSLNTIEGISVAFTPLNGAGYRLVPDILKTNGLKESQLYIVKEQSYPDGNFTTCSYPNPEKPEALRLGLELASEKKVDILIATDPDADRMGIAVLHENEYKLMSGNEVGVLLTDYIFSQKKQKGILPNSPVMAKSIVSTDMASKVAKQYGAECFNVLTGFKYIGDVIAKLEKSGRRADFVLGFEESYGYLSGTYVRDKDAVVASMLTAEMCAYHKKQGKTLVDRMNELYEKFGTYQHKVRSFEYPGAEGNAKMKQLMQNIRDERPFVIASIGVADYTDYMTQEKFDLPKANVLCYDLEDGSQIIIRPSGTEPLIKTYVTACKTVKENEQVFEKVNKYLDDLLA